MINVVQVLPPGYLHAHALDDLARYLTHALTACGYEVTTHANELVPGALDIVVGAHLLTPAALAALPPRAIVFNSEPRFEWAPAYRDALARFTVWDYSATNAIGTVIPFAYRPELREVAHVPGDALLFYGSMTPHRRHVLEALRERVAVDLVFGEYGDRLRARLARCRAVLNLHKTADRATFEPVRCFYPLIQGIPVISEPTTDPSADPFRAAMTFADELATAPVVDPRPFAATEAAAIRALRLAIVNQTSDPGVRCP